MNINLSNINSGLTVDAIIGTLFYSFMGILIMLISVLLINKMFNLDMHRELVKENNVAFGVLIGCVTIAIAIIIAGTILS